MASALFLCFTVLSCFWLRPFLALSFPLVSSPAGRGYPLNEVSISSNTCSWDFPQLAVITEPDACANDERASQTLAVLRKALTAPGIDLVSVRVTSDTCPSQVVHFIRELVAMVQQNQTKVVVTSDWVDAAIEGGAHGIHVKESHQIKIPMIRHQFASRVPLIGTSAHSLESAQNAVRQYQPDYLFVGTCYPTETHPEKSVADLEGPMLPGQVARAIGNVCPVLAIGGINAKNCAEPVAFGASGVATIRAILQAKDPADVVQDMVDAMKQAS
jgi:thiamine-phosphate diphosphorylase